MFPFQLFLTPNDNLLEAKTNVLQPKKEGKLHLQLLSVDHERLMTVLKFPE